MAKILSILSVRRVGIASAFAALGYALGADQRTVAALTDLFSLAF